MLFNHLLAIKNVLLIESLDIRIQFFKEIMGVKRWAEHS